MKDKITGLKVQYTHTYLRKLQKMKLKSHDPKNTFFSFFFEYITKNLYINPSGNFFFY